VEAWDFKCFKQIRNRYFKVGEDDDGYSVKVSLSPSLAASQPPSCDTTISDEIEILFEIFEINQR
jgi:hypothetical protein